MRHQTVYCPLVLNKVSTSVGSVEKAKKTYRNLNWRSWQQAFQNNIDEIIAHYKTTKSKAQKPPTETVKKF